MSRCEQDCTNGWVEIPKGVEFTTWAGYQCSNGGVRFCPECRPAPLVIG